MFEKINVSGYTEFGQTISQCLKDGKQVFIYFVGDRVDGKSWCPDCVTSDNYMDDVLKQASSIDAKKPRVFITCLVGDREEQALFKDNKQIFITHYFRWKNPVNPFRKELGLKSIPSFMEYGNKVLDEDLLTRESALKTLSDVTGGTV